MDVFSKSIRKFIPYSAFEKWFLRHEVRSRISDYLSLEKYRDFRERIENRIEELEQLEKEKGFVFVGEKLWLQDFLDSRRFPRYDQWVAHIFANELEVNFEFVDYTDIDGVLISDIEGLPPKIWKANIDPNKVLTGLKGHRTCGMAAEVELNVYGTVEGPSPAHLVKMFELLHLLEYMLDIYCKGDLDISDTELAALSVEHPSTVMSWTIDLQSSYNSWDFHLRNRSSPYLT